MVHYNIHDQSVMGSYPCSYFVMARSNFFLYWPFLCTFTSSTPRGLYVESSANIFFQTLSAVGEIINPLGVITAMCIF